jgi:hypothetical protein
MTISRLRAFLLLPVLLALPACGGDPTSSQDSQPDAVLDSGAAPEAVIDPVIEIAPPPPAQAVDMNGRVTISVDRLIEERDPNNCLVMMKVENGTDETVSAGLFAFEVNGNEQSAGGNMFPQTAAPGQSATAQIILPGRTCAVAERIVGGQSACMTEGETPCLDVLDFEDGEVDFTIND